MLVGNGIGCGAKDQGMKKFEETGKGYYFRVSEGSIARKHCDFGPVKSKFPCDLKPPSLCWLAISSKRKHTETLSVPLIFISWRVAMWGILPKLLAQVVPGSSL